MDKLHNGFMAQTGYQRSLTVLINKKVAGVQLTGYPKKYSGLRAFTINNIAYQEITSDDLASMFIDKYKDRLEAFKNYVQSLETGLQIDATMISGSEAYRKNTDACPIGGASKKEKQS